MHAATPLLGLLVAALSLSGCLGVDNMAELKADLGFAPEPLAVHAPIARLQASPTLATVGLPVAFTAQGSEDPQGQPLAFAWDFGDGSVATGSEATHAFLTRGTFPVHLTATDAAGLSGQASALVTVTANAPPVVAFSVLKGQAAVARALVGDDLAFESQARDPEGQPLALHWDFGDGGSALAAEAHHAYAHGGRYTVVLQATDPQGAAASAAQGLAIDEPFAGQGEVLAAPAGPSSWAKGLDVAGGAQHVAVAVDFDAGYGVNALRAELLDPQGRVVQTETTQPAPLTEGLARVALDVPADQLAGHAPGSWQLVITLVSGVDVPFTFTGEAQY